MNAERQRALRGYVARGAIGPDGMALPPKYVIPGDDSKPRPLVPYATVLVGTDRQIGYADGVERTDADGNLREIVIEEWEALVYVQFFRAGAKERARRFGAWLDSPDGRLWEERMGLVAPPSGPLRGAGGRLTLDSVGRAQYAGSEGWGGSTGYQRTFGRMAIQAPISYRQIDEIVSVGLEERAGIDLVVRYTDHSAQAVGPITEIPVTVSGQPQTIIGR